MVGGWVSLRPEGAVATAWPPWCEMDPDIREKVQAGLESWASSKQILMTFAEEFGTVDRTWTIDAK